MTVSALAIISMLDVATITLPLWLAVGQWVLLFAFGFLVIVMYRQLGYLLALSDRGIQQEGPAIGGRAPAFSYIVVSPRSETPSRFEPVGMWSLLLFAEPTCVSCRGALRDLMKLAPQWPQTLRVLVVTTADPTLIRAIDEFHTDVVEISTVSTQVPGAMYNTRVTPFAVLIDPGGIVRAKGVAGDATSLRKLVRTMADARTLPIAAGLTE